MSEAFHIEAHAGLQPARQRRMHPVYVALEAMDLGQTIAITTPHPESDVVFAFRKRLRGFVVTHKKKWPGRQFETGVDRTVPNKYLITRVK